MQRRVGAMVVGALVTAGAVLAVALLVVPEESRSSLFWPRVLWTEFLVVLAWAWWGGFVEAILRRPAGHGAGGMMSGMGLLIGVYVVASFAGLLVEMAFGDSAAAWRVHLACQVVLAAGVLLAFTLIHLAGAASPRDRG